MDLTHVGGMGLLLSILRGAFLDRPPTSEAISPLSTSLHAMEKFTMMTIVSILESCGTSCVTTRGLLWRFSTAQ